MKRPPSPLNNLKQRFILLVLFLTFGPVVLMTVARVLDTVLTPLVPWLITVLILFGLYRLVIGRYRR